MAKKSVARSRGSKGAVAPTQAIKGIGRMGLVENTLNPLVVDPSRSKRGSALTAQLLGPQGRKG